MTRMGVLAAALLAGWPEIGQAQDTPVTPVPNCETAETQVDMNACAALDYQEADADLNDAYAAALKVMQGVDAAQSAGDTGAVAALKEAQRSWIAFRDLACISEGWMNHGGSVEPLVVSSCKTRLTAARADDLWALTEENGNP